MYIPRCYGSIYE